MMDRQSKQSEVTEEMLQEFFNKGGTITVCPPMARTEDIGIKGGGYYNSKKKKTEKDSK
jgi:hypothetical protein